MLTKPQTAREFPAAGLLGRSDHDRLCRVRDGRADGRHQPQGVRADHAGRPAVARWGMYVESKGKQGEQCDMPSACKLMDYLHEWETATDPAVRRKAWDEILADQRRRGILDRHGERDPPARSSSGRRSATSRRKATTPGIRADTSGSTSPTRSGSASRADPPFHPASAARPVGAQVIGRVATRWAATSS